MNPCHLWARSGDRTALCGSTDLPIMLARYVGAHRRTRTAAGAEPLTICPTCIETARTRGIPLDERPRRPR